MPIGQNLDYLEETDDFGNVTRRLVPREHFPSAGGEADLRRHWTLSSAYDAGHPLRIVANQIITVESPGTFTKYGLLVRDSGFIVYVGFDKRVSAAPGDYDDLHPGNGLREERLEGANTITLLLPAAPPNPVELFVYAGRPALPA